MTFAAYGQWGLRCACLASRQSSGCCQSERTSSSHGRTYEGREDIRSWKRGVADGSGAYSRVVTLQLWFINIYFIFASHRKLLYVPSAFPLTLTLMNTEASAAGV